MAFDWGTGWEHFQWSDLNDPVYYVILGLLVASLLIFIGTDNEDRNH